MASVSMTCFLAAIWFLQRYGAPVEKEVAPAGKASGIDESMRAEAVKEVLRHNSTYPFDALSKSCGRQAVRTHLNLPYFCALQRLLPVVNCTRSELRFDTGCLSAAMHGSMELQLGEFLHLIR